jgi:hypothetical protein
MQVIGILVFGSLLNIVEVFLKINYFNRQNIKSFIFYIEGCNKSDPIQNKFTIKNFEINQNNILKYPCLKGAIIK